MAVSNIIMFSDPLKRDFVPCGRIVAQSDAAGTEHLVGSQILRIFTANDYPVCVIAKGGFVLLDFGMELSGGIRLVTSGSMNSCRIRIRFGESCSEAMGKPNQDHTLHDIRVTVPRYSAMSFGNTGFRFVRIDALSGELALHNVIAVYKRRGDPQLGRFHSSDALLNRIFDTCVHTIRLNMQDYVLDGVKRDRQVWGGDLNPEAMVILRIFGDVPVLRETLELLRLHTGKGHFINDYSSYSLWYFITLFDHWLYSGDDSLLKANRNFIESEAPRFAGMVGADGGEMLPPRRFLDWPSDRRPEAVHAGLQPLLLMALRAMKKMLVHLHSQVVIPETLLEKLRNHVPSPVGSKAAAALQMLSGMAERSDVLENHPFAGISTYFGYYILLSKKNRPALELIRKYWGAMLELGATSFWEDFDLDWVAGATGIDELPLPGRPDIHRDFGRCCYRGLRHSLCHGWAAGPAAWCSRRILGVEPLEPGFRKIAFHPDLGDLEYAEGTVPTPHGIISVSLRKGGKPTIKIPDGIDIRENSTREGTG